MRDTIVSKRDTAPAKGATSLAERIILALGAVVLALWLAFLAWIAYRIVLVIV